VITYRREDWRVGAGGVATPVRSQILLPYPHAGQRAVRRAMRRFTALCAGRRWRKTTLKMSRTVEEANEGARILWGAPVFDQVYVGAEEARKATAGVARFNQGRMTLDFPSGGRVIYRSLDDPDNARGHTVDGVVIDEPADVRPEAWHEVLRPMLMDTGGWAILGGTPKGQTNWFYQLFKAWAGMPDATVWQIPTVGCRITEDKRLERAPHPLENPHIPWEEIVSVWETSTETAFRQEILAEFVADVLDLWTREMFDRTRFDPGEEHPPLHVVGRYISWDTALKDTAKAAQSACVVGELLSDYTLRIVDLWADRVPFPLLTDRMDLMWDKWRGDGKLLGEIIEDKASGTSAVQTISAAAPELDAVLGASRGDRVVPFMPSGSKEQRWAQAAVWCHKGAVRLPRPHEKAPWLHVLERQLFDDPGTGDIRDAFAQLVLYLEHYLAEGVHGRGATVRAPSGAGAEV
jgi:phage terminase large subunit-like protein